MHCDVLSSYFSMPSTDYLMEFKSDGISWDTATRIFQTLKNRISSTNRKQVNLYLKYRNTPILPLHRSRSALRSKLYHKSVGARNLKHSKMFIRRRAADQLMGALEGHETLLGRASNQINHTEE